MVDSVVTENTFTEVSSEALATTLQLCIINLQFVNQVQCFPQGNIQSAYELFITSAFRLKNITCYSRFKVLPVWKSLLA